MSHKSVPPCSLLVPSPLTRNFYGAAFGPNPFSGNTSTKRKSEGGQHLVSGPLVKLQANFPVNQSLSHFVKARELNATLPLLNKVHPIRASCLLPIIQFPTITKIDPSYPFQCGRERIDWPADALQSSAGAG
jgi:hypothetical protein